jgi:lysophospholipase L1-like esterase
VNASLPKRFERYVALGDSSTEGLEDPDDRGGYRGWSQRLAQRIADGQGALEYANFGVRGRTTRQILRHQLAPALALRPDLATLFSGTNDLAARRFDATAVSRDMEEMQRALIGGGATVLTFTLPDLTPVMPIARWIAPRIRALNEALRSVSASTGAVLIDFAACAVASDPRVWADDRIHANAIGHARIADALAEAIELPGSSDSWRQPLPPMRPKSRREWLAAEMSWTRRHLLPWIGRGLRLHPAGSPGEPREVALRRVESMSSTRTVVPTRDGASGSGDLLKNRFG